MATLKKRGQRYRVVFFYCGKRFSRSLSTRDEKAANGSLARAEETLRRIELGTLPLPPDVDLASFVVSEGLSAKRQKVTKSVPLNELFAGYFASLPEGSLEEVTIE